MVCIYICGPTGWVSLESETVNMVMSPAELGPAAIVNYRQVHLERAFHYNKPQLSESNTNPFMMCI
jgi:hypothetical protein